MTIKIIFPGGPKVCLDDHAHSPLVYLYYMMIFGAFSGPAGTNSFKELAKYIGPLDGLTRVKGVASFNKLLSFPISE